MRKRRHSESCPPASRKPGARPLPRKPRLFPVPVLRQAVGWVLGRLRQRHGLSPRELAALARVGPQTVRDVEQGRCPECAWSTCARLCHALHRRLEEVERIAHRLLWWLYRRQARQNRGRTDWKLTLPWGSNGRAN